MLTGFTTDLKIVTTYFQHKGIRPYSYRKEVYVIYTKYKELK